MNSPVRVALLGPTEVRVGNEMVPIAGTKLQSVLALLALAAPHPVPDGRLVEELWGDAHAIARDRRDVGRQGRRFPARRLRPHGPSSPRGLMSR